MRWIWPQQTIAITISVESVAASHPMLHFRGSHASTWGPTRFNPASVSFCTVTYFKYLWVISGLRTSRFNQNSTKTLQQERLLSSLPDFKPVPIQSLYSAMLGSKTWGMMSHSFAHVQTVFWMSCLWCTKIRQVVLRLSLLMALRQARICRNATKLSGITTGRQTWANTLGMHNPTTLTPSSGWVMAIRDQKVQNPWIQFTIPRNGTTPMNKMHKSLQKIHTVNICKQNVLIDFGDCDNNDPILAKVCFEHSLNKKQHLSGASMIRSFNNHNWAWTPNSSKIWVPQSMVCTTGVVSTALWCIRTLTFCQLG